MRRAVESLGMTPEEDPAEANGVIGGVPQRRAIRRASLHEQVAERLREIIACGDLAAGDRINEVALAGALGVSRTPMREAVKLLASEGFLELLPGRGARVKRLSPDEILDIFEVIGALERHAVECAVARMTPRAMARIERLHRRMEEEFSKRNRRTYFQANQRMHAMLVALSGSPTLVTAHGALTKRARHDRHATLMSDQRWAESMAEHTALFEAILAGDAPRAGALMLDHSRRTGAAIAAMDGG